MMMMLVLYYYQEHWKMGMLWRRCWCCCRMPGTVINRCHLHQDWRISSCMIFPDKESSLHTSPCVVAISGSWLAILHVAWSTLPADNVPSSHNSMTAVGCINPQVQYMFTEDVTVDCTDCVRWWWYQWLPLSKVNIMSYCFTWMIHIVNLYALSNIVIHALLPWLTGWIVIERLLELL